MEARPSGSSRRLEIRPIGVSDGGRSALLVRRPMSTHDALETESATLREDLRRGTDLAGAVESTGVAANAPKQLLPATDASRLRSDDVQSFDEGGSPRSAVAREAV